jgi:hypothetical protein
MSASKQAHLGFWSMFALAVLSNGELLAAPLETLGWQPILPDVGDARALAIANL